MLKNFVVIAALAMCCFSALASSEKNRPPAEKVIFDGAQLPASWKFQTTEGASFKPPQDGVEFTIDAWQEGREMWPRLELLGPDIDLSEYSQLQIELENTTGDAQDIALSVNETTEKRVAQAFPLPPRSTIKARLNISDGAMMNQSRVTHINLYAFRPHTSASYRLKKITAIANPDYVSARAALEARLREVQQMRERFGQNAALKNANTVQWKNAQQLIDDARQAMAQQAPGYLSQAQEQLETARQNISQLNIHGRGKELVVWSSPLGLAVRDNTLPEASDRALTKINKTVCLNEYEAICVNISAASKPQKVRVALNEKSAQDGFISLRPAVLVKARDGSQTADAIGKSVSEITLEIAPYQTRQFLVWIDTKTSKARAGKHAASLALSTPDGSTPKANNALQTIPIEVDVADVRLDSHPLKVMNWAYFYLGQSSTLGLETQARDNLRDYGVNMWMIYYDQIPLPRVDADGKYAGLDAGDRNRIERFRQLLDLLKGRPHETFVLELGFHRAEVRELLSRPGVLQGYLQDLRAILDEFQIPLENRCLHFWDEPTLDQVKEIVRWMKAVRAVDASWNFFDNTSSPPFEGAERDEYARLTKTSMPNWEQFFLAQPQKAAQLKTWEIDNTGFYRCLMSRNNRGVNIYEYYRLMSWHAMQHGLGSVGFWTYNSGHGEDAWDGTTGPASGGTVVYQKDGALFSSRRWELFREGLEDYKLAQAAFGQKSRLDAAKNPALMNLCRQVAGHPEDYNRADAAREKMISLSLERITSEKS